MTATVAALRESRFETEATTVLDGLRSAMGGLLSDLGGIGKAADLQHRLSLDPTLAWQLFKIATASNSLSAGSAVPSKAALKRMLEAAKVKGVGAAREAEIWAAHERFEELVTNHADDRVTFNSMVASVAGIDHERKVTALHHRRNMFRGLSYAKGYQVKASVLSAIVRGSHEEGSNDIAMLSGSVGLRVLRPLESLMVYGTRFVRGDQKLSRPSGAPLRINESCGGFLIEEFSTSPVPKLQTSEGQTNDSSWFEARLEWPEVGNMGASNFFFGDYTAGLQRTDGKVAIPAVPGDIPTVRYHNSRATEVLLIDVLVDPSWIGEAKPKPVARWLSNGPAEGQGDYSSKLEGDFEVERLGKGPGALGTPDVPHYPNLLRLVAKKLSWDIENYVAVRMKVEYPMYQTVLGIEWKRD